MVSKSNRKSRDDRGGNNSVRKSDISKKHISPVDASAETGPPSLRRSTRGAIQREEITSTLDTKAQSGKESTSERPNTRNSADLSKKDAPPPVKRKSEVKASVSAAKTQPEKISTTAHSNVKNTTEVREKDSLLPAKRKLEVLERKKVLSSPLRRSERGKIQLPLLSSDTNNNGKVTIIDVPEKDTPPPAKRKLKVLQREKVSPSPLRRSEGGNKQPPLLSSDTNNNRKVTIIDVLEKDTPPPAKRKFKVLEREKVSPNPLRRSERGKKQPSLMFSDTNNNGKVTVMKNVSMKKQKREKNLEELALEDKETNKDAKEEEKSNGRKRKTANASMYKRRFRQQGNSFVLLQETFISETVAEYARPDDSLDVDVNDGKKSTHPIHELGDEMMFDATKFVEYWVPVSMSNVQLEQYCATLLSNSTTLRNSSSKDIVGGALQEILFSIKKICDHPYNQDSGLQKLLTKDLLPVEYLDVGIEASGKLHFLDILLSEIRSRGKRVLILYQSRSAGSLTGDILDDFLRQRFGPDSYERIEKDILRSKKQAALNLFNDKSSGRFVFLLEKRACSPTLKLSAVNAVLIFDSDWNLMNDNIALDKLSIDPSPEPLKIFRLYTSCTLEEKVLDLATNHVSLDSNLQNIRRMTSHMLLMWGASCIFRRLDRFHGIRDASQSGASLCSDISMLKDVVDELLGLLIQNAENSCKSSLITKVRHNGVKYDKKGPLFGQSKVQSTNGKEPHQFWNELLEQKNPHWRFLSGCSQRNRKSAQDFGDLPKKPDDGPGDLTKKQKNFLNRSVDAPPLPRTGLIESESPAITEEAQKAKSWLKIKSSGELSGSQFYDGQENIGLISGTCQTPNRTEMTKVETIPVTTAREKVRYGVTIGYETVISQSLCATITIEAQVGNLGGPSDVSGNAVVCNLPPISEEISDEAFCAREEDTTAPHKFPVSAKSLEASDLDVEFNRVNKEIIGINILDSDLVENDTEDNITDRKNVGCGVTTENPIICLRSLGGTDPGGASDAQEANVNAPNEVVGDIKSLETSITDGGDNTEFSDTNLAESVLVEKSSYAPSYALEENVTSPNEVVGVVKSLETSNPDGGDNTVFSDANLSDSVPVEKSACALPYAQEVNVTTSNEVVGVVKSSETSNPDEGDNTEFIDTNSSEPVLVENSTYTSGSTRHDGNFCTESPLVRSHVKQIIKNRSEDAVLSHKFAPPVQCHRPLTSASILDEDVTSCENTTNVLEQAEVEQLHLITAEFRQADSSAASLVSRDGCTRAYESYNVTDVIESWTTFAPSNPELAELELPHVEHFPSQNREQSATQSDPNMLPSLPTQTVEEVLDRDDSQVGISPSINTPVVGFRAHYPSGQARQVDLQAQSQLLLSDPLKFESDRLFKEGEKAAKCFEDAKQQLRIEYEKEKEEVIAEIHRKYVAKVKDADADYLLKKKELDVIRRKVLMNRILAEAFTTKCLGGKPSVSSVPSTSFLHQVLLLSAQSQRTSAVSGLPKFVPPVASQQTAPSFAANPPSSPAIGNRQMRPPHMLPNTRPNSNFPIPSDIRARNLPISGEIRSRAPHLQPSLPTAAPTFRPASQGLSGLYPQRNPSTTAQVSPRVLTQLPQQPVPTPLPHTNTMGFRNPSVPAVRLFNGENLPRACTPNVLPSALNADINLDALYLLRGGVQCGGKVGRGVNFASSSVVTEVVCLSDDE